ncbi:MAG: peptide chain release factor N(5)-glutamine methyltransferase [Prevotellaceae bacterium]|nr:peptide chain release factor N(5)-glutamine methyltransferase [Prevotellaceae bacterium]
MRTIVPYIRRTLQEHYPTREAANLSRIICCEMLGVRTVDYYSGKDITLSPNDMHKLTEILMRLCHFEPIQYIQGTARFMGHTFHVTPAVLIPRPETEELTEIVVQETAPGARILDMGTGSGCMAVSLSIAIPDAQVEAWDLSEAALAVARENNAALGGKVCFKKRDMLEGMTGQVDETARFDVIVSNPPYVREMEKREMDRQVLDWEPSLALFVPDEDPLLFYRAIAAWGRKLLLAGGKVYVEINRAFGSEVTALFQASGYADARLWKDISGNDRFVTATR